MFDRWFGIQLHDYLQALGLFILAFGVPMNKVLMSIGTIWLAANLLLKLDFKTYWERWQNNLVFWGVIGILILHLVGFVYTDDRTYALGDLNAKLPFFVIPVCLIAYPIEQRFFKFILYGFLLSLLITSGFNFRFLLENQGSDYRDFSLFGSHIRYALLVVTGILVSFYLLLRNKKLALVFALLIVWFGFYTIVSQVFNGYIALVFLILAIFIYWLTYMKSIVWRRFLIAGVGLVAVVAIVFYFSFFQGHQHAATFEHLATVSRHGETYYHDTLSDWYENKHHVRSNIAFKELEQGWGERSTMAFHHQFEAGHTIEDILIRYMASKGLTKDREGMQQLSDKDIHNVEQGKYSILLDYPPIQRKVAILRNDFFQFSMGSDPNGNSLLQRIEHWRAAKEIIKENWLFGVGTGDVQQAFDRQYTKMNTRLYPENWNRAHNQFLTFWVTFGVVGFVLFLTFWVYFFFYNLQYKNLIGIGFTLIAISSFLSEDTIETQQGVTYIALFLGLSSMMNYWQSTESNANMLKKYKKVE